MEQIWNNLSKKQKIGLLAGGIILILLIVLATVAIINRDEPIARIKNLDNYLVGATASDKDHLQKELYTFLTRQYTNTEINKLDIYIRDDTYVAEQADEASFADFIIDIDELKISYLVSFVFPNEMATSENPIFDCPPIEDMKYPETECVGMFNSSAELKIQANNPISAILPISVDKYDFGSRETIKYEILGYYDEESGDFIVRIIDYSGGNYDLALQEIRNRGYNPEDYTIDYVNYAE